jgi:hypothetical protein
MRKLLSVWTATAILATALPAAGGEEARQGLCRRAALAAARADAAARLSAKVLALKVAAATTVEAFAAQRLEIAAGLDAFLRELVEAAKAQQAPDGSCRVSVVLTLDALAERLKQLHTAAFRDKASEAVTAATMVKLNAVKAVTADGFGNPPEALLPPPLLATPAGAPHAELAQADPAVQAFWKANATPRGLMLTELSATHRAYARLAAAIELLPIREGLRVRDVLGAPDSAIRGELARYVRQGPEAGRRYHGNVLLVEVELAVPIDSFHQTLLTWAKLHGTTNRAHLRAMEEAVLARKPGNVSACGMAAVPVKHLTKQASGAVRQAAQLACDAPAWLADTMPAEGQAPPANDPMQALHAAQRDAAGQLNEAVLRLPIPGRSTVKDFAAGDKEFLSAIESLCKAAESVPGVQCIQPDGSVRVTVSLELEFVWRAVLHHHLKQMPKPDWSTKLE